MIDIIIPIYNGREYLPNALESITSQNIRDKIIVTIIDDASSCEYQDIIQKYQDKLPIKYIRLNKNMGPGNARNIGIKNTRAEYIIFFDCDDIFASTDSASILYNTISNSNNLNMVCGHSLVCNIELFSYDAVWARIFRRSFIEKYHIKFPKLYCHEDSYFVLLVESLSGKENIKNVENLVYIKKDINPNSCSMCTGDNILNKIDTFYNIFEKILKITRKYKCEQNAYYEIPNIFITMCCYYRRMFKYNVSEADMAKALKTCQKFYNRYEKEIIKNITLEEQKRDIYNFVKLINNS